MKRGGGLVVRPAHNHPQQQQQQRQLQAGPLCHSPVSNRGVGGPCSCQSSSSSVEMVSQERSGGLMPFDPAAARGPRCCCCCRRRRGPAAAVGREQEGRSPENRFSSTGRHQGGENGKNGPLRGWGGVGGAQQRGHRQRPGAQAIPPLPPPGH